MVKKLTFLESYIDEETKDNYWRGISAYCDGIQIFLISLEVNDNKWYLDGKNYFCIENKFFPSQILNKKLDPIYIEGQHDIEKGGYKIYTDKEEVKEAAQKAFEHYINLFVM